jgi:NAD dependent epimerase/dehydratase
MDQRLGGRVLVTGGDGFIGSHLVERLVREGNTVRATACYNSFGTWGWLDDLAPEIRREVEIVSLDIRDGDCVRAAVKGCETVLHLAALIAIPFSYRSPESYVQTNIQGTLNLLLASRDLGVRRLVHTSTSEVYGTARFVPITEEHPLQAQSPYAASKIAADQMALAFQRSFGLPVAVIRPFNTYGPRQSARAVIPTIITQTLTGQKQIRLGSVHPTRDFSFVEDTVSGFLAVARAEAAVGEVINIGSGHEISIQETLGLIGEITGLTLEVLSDEPRVRPAASEVERLLAGTAKAQRLLGWAPAHGGRDGLRRGLARTIEWFRDPAVLRRYKADCYNV